MEYTAKKVEQTPEQLEQASEHHTERSGAQPFIRLLTADEIECRAATVSEKGVTLLLFKDARVDQKILDEMFTPFGWKRSHQAIDGSLYCTVEIWDGEKQEWISKQDVGTVSYSEKEKGQASDSFKRACFNWGIGRELYTAPFIWIPAAKTTIQPRGDKYYCNERFKVSAIAYDENRAISALTIVNSRNEEVYTFGQAKKASGKSWTPDKQKAGKAKTAGVQGNGASEAATAGTTSAADTMPFRTSATAISHAQKAAMQKELDRTGVALQAILDRYRIQSEEQMTKEIYESAMKGLSKTGSRTRQAAA